MSVPRDNDRLSMILPWLFVSGSQPAQDPSAVTSANIQTIVNCVGDTVKNVFERKRARESEGGGGITLPPDPFPSSNSSSSSSSSALLSHSSLSNASSNRELLRTGREEGRLTGGDDGGDSEGGDSSRTSVSQKALLGRDSSKSGSTICSSISSGGPAVIRYPSFRYRESEKMQHAKGGIPADSDQMASAPSRRETHQDDHLGTSVAFFSRRASSAAPLALASCSSGSARVPRLLGKEPSSRSEGGQSLTPSFSSPSDSRVVTSSFSSSATSPSSYSLSSSGGCSEECSSAASTVRSLPASGALEETAAGAAIEQQQENSENSGPRTLPSAATRSNSRHGAPGRKLASSSSSATAPSSLPSGSLSHLVPWPVAYITLFLSDGIHQDILPVFYRIIDAIEATRASGGCTLIHCEQGISRSGSLALAYVMWLRGGGEGGGFREALSFVRASRACVSPNVAFSCQLLEWETHLRLIGTRPDGYCASLEEKKSDAATPLPSISTKLNVGKTTDSIISTAACTALSARSARLISFEGNKGESVRGSPHAAQKPASAISCLSSLPSVAAGTQLRLSSSKAVVADDPDSRSPDMEMKRAPCFLYRVSRMAQYYFFSSCSSARDNVDTAVGDKDGTSLPSIALRPSHKSSGSPAETEGGDEAIPLSASAKRKPWQFCVELVHQKRNRIRIEPTLAHFQEPSSELFIILLPSPPSGSEGGDANPYQAFIWVGQILARGSNLDCNPSPSSALASAPTSSSSSPTSSSFLGLLAANPRGLTPTSLPLGAQRDPSAAASHKVPLVRCQGAHPTPTPITPPFLSLLHSLHPSAISSPLHSAYSTSQLGTNRSHRSRSSISSIAILSPRERAHRALASYQSHCLLHTLSSDSAGEDDHVREDEEDEEEDHGEEEEEGGDGVEVEDFIEASIAPAHLRDAIVFAIAEVQTWASLWRGGGRAEAGQSPGRKKGIRFNGVLTQGVDDMMLLSILTI